ncbi:uncharacterized protein LOC116111086, partial [Pistacia vera]|uniref:uncharacterized protein LOC116111086 n=1 Tax=Pistacia vera TaxID=55513 RepID=UPI001263CF2A
PPEFRGTTDPSVAEKWIRSVERKTALFPKIDWKQIRYASFLFKSDARILWKLMEETHDVATMSWGDFRRLFEAEYRTADRMHEKIQEFFSLRQVISLVKEHSFGFNSLGRFAPGIESTPELRMNKFVHRLNLEIARDVMASAQPPQTYNEALERALRAEVFVNKLTLLTPSAVVSSIPPPAPQRDRCRQPRHMMKDCKAPPTTTTQTSRGTNAQVFTVAQSEAKASASVVTDGHQLSMLISSVNAKKMLRKWCSGYIAHVVQSSDVPRSEIQNVLVVREFPDVFLDDLPGLPPEREMEFSIELAPGTTPISKAPYRMALSELQ